MTPTFTVFSPGRIFCLNRPFIRSPFLSFVLHIGARLEFRTRNTLGTSPPQKTVYQESFFCLELYLKRHSLTVSFLSPFLGADRPLVRSRRGVKPDDRFMAQTILFLLIHSRATSCFPPLGGRSGSPTGYLDFSSLCAFFTKDSLATLFY